MNHNHTDIYGMVNDNMYKQQGDWVGGWLGVGWVGEGVGDGWGGGGGGHSFTSVGWEHSPAMYLLYGDLGSLLGSFAI